MPPSSLYRSDKKSEISLAPISHDPLKTSCHRPMLPRVNILGVAVSAIDMQLALTTIESWISRKEPNYVCVRDVHGVVRCQSDRNLRSIHNNAGLVTPDGMPLVWLSWLAGFRHVKRVYGPDLMLALCERSLEGGYRHFLYGGAPEVTEKLASNLRQQYPRLKIVGAYSPPFHSLITRENDKIIAMINAASPDIVWVGLSTPKQEQWMVEHLGYLNAPVMIGVGAAFDFHAGVTKQAPLWIQRSGFEWLFRLAIEPRRLWRRYFTVVPLFLFYVLMQTLGFRKYSLDGNDRRAVTNRP